MDTTIPKSNEENVPELARLVLRNWHLVIVLLGIIVSVVISWSHFQFAVEDLQKKVDATQLQGTALNSNIQDISPQISAINAKLDIIIKHDGL